MRKIDPEIRRARKAESSRKWNAANYDPVRQKAYNDRMADVRKGQRRERDYGVSPEQYRALWLSQQGECAVCGRSEDENMGRALALDHDHGTGAVRSLLCHRCNVGMGLLSDSPVHLRMAAEYLEVHNG